MPTYSYKCDRCKTEEDKFYHNPDNAPIFIECTTCFPYKSEMYRQIGAGGGFIFKGAGFHINDYPKENKDVPQKEE